MSNECHTELVEVLLYQEANGLGFISYPYSRFPLYFVPLQSGLIRICIAFLYTMKKILLLLFVITFASCKKEAEDNFGQPKTDETAVAVSGEELFSGKGTCTACHLPDQKVIGPSIAEIAKTYKEKNGSIVAFLKEEAEPLVNPSQYETMKTNFAITKQMSEAELKALEAYMLSFAK